MFTFVILFVFFRVTSAFLIIKTLLCILLEPLKMEITKKQTVLYYYLNADKYLS